MNGSPAPRAARAGVRGEEGFALLFVLLVALVVGALATSAVSMVGNAALLTTHAETQAAMEDAALSGAELARAYLNANPDAFPEAGYAELPAAALPLRDAHGRAIPGLTRRVYAGPTGISTGQYGVFGSVVSVVEDARRNRVVFRREMVQESFAKYAYFTDRETDPQGNPIYFAPGDQLFGPVHSNDAIRVLDGTPKPVFHGPASTSRTVPNARAASFRQGLTEYASRIELPPVARLTRLQTLAQQGGTAIVGSSVGTAGQATTRIEFVAIDLDGDGRTTGANEGFFKVYQSWSANSTGARWVVGGRPSDMRVSESCGHRHRIAGRDYFYTIAQHNDTGFRDAAGLRLEAAATALQNTSGSNPTRCYLGGSDSLSTDLSFRPQVTNVGRWVRWSGTWATPMPAAVAARTDREYLFPLGRDYNPDFRGVVHVTGKVAISGVLRGRVTLAATGNIVIADDVVYATDPAAANCADVLGLFAGGDIVVADNSVNAPVNASTSSWSTDYRTYDDTSDEVVHAVLLTLGSFGVENYSGGATRAEDCEGQWTGRGCLYVTGGIIQSRRGAVGQSASGGASGYLKRYSYDQCAASDPPPYFPTTGYFARGRLYEVDPVGFDVARYFDRITGG